jgi:uncharacterized protein YjiS (DUF1127 family)
MAADRLLTGFLPAGPLFPHWRAWPRALRLALRAVVTRRERAARPLADAGAGRGGAPAEVRCVSWDLEPSSPRRRPATAEWRRSLAAAWRRQRSRRRIAQLDAHALKDIGVSYAEAEAEANKPFWRR